MLQELPADQISAVATLMERYADHPMDPAGFDTCRTGAGKRFKNLFLP